jgi:hypothetical protein
MARGLLGKGSSGAIHPKEGRADAWLNCVCYPGFLWWGGALGWVVFGDPHLIQTVLRRTVGWMAPDDLQDSIGFAAGDANLYRYVGNTALDETDPTGKQQNGDDPSQEEGKQTEAELWMERQWLLASTDIFAQHRLSTLYEIQYSVWAGLYNNYKAKKMDKLAASIDYRKSLEAIKKLQDAWIAQVKKEVQAGIAAAQARLSLQKELARRNYYAREAWVSWATKVAAQLRSLYDNEQIEIAEGVAAGLDNLAREAEDKQNQIRMEEYRSKQVVPPREIPPPTATPGRERLLQPAATPRGGFLAS